MDKILQADLLKEILAVEKRVNALGTSQSVKTRWGTSGEPFEVSIGADIECYAYNRAEKQKIGLCHRRANNALLGAAYNLCAKDLCKRPFFECFSMELNPRPGSAQQIIDRYTSFQKINAQATKIGWDFAVGAGHWHLSLRDKGAGSEKSGHLLNDNRIGGGYSSFAKELGRNLVAIQCLCPALFFRPSRAEKRPGSVMFTHLVDVYKRSPTIDGEDDLNRQCSVQMDGERYPNKALMFELRMAHLSPHVPVLMLLHATERTLMGHQIVIDDYNTNPLCHRPGDDFVRGKGCTIDYIEATAKCGYVDRHFPRLAPALVRECIRAYDGFLETPSWSTMYSENERDIARYKLREKYPRALQPLPR